MEFRNFHEKFDLNITAPEQEQQPHVRMEFSDNRYSRFSELPRRMEKHNYHHSAEAQRHEGEAPQSNTPEGCIDHLLILAQSAEIIAQSEDGMTGMRTNNQNEGSHNHQVEQISQEYGSNITTDDQECFGELLDRLSVTSHVSSQRSRVYYKDTRPRLTQIRKQARCKYLILDKERAEDNQCKHFQGKIIRLSQIKHQARCKTKNKYPPKEMITGPRNEQPQGRILRLSQMKHQARSKGNATVKERTEEHMDGSVCWNRFKDFNLSLVEGVPAHNVFRGASQSSVGNLGHRNFRKPQSASHQFSAVRWDDENLREHQRTARRLRAFKTKRLRQRLRTECTSNSANIKLHGVKMSPIGLTSITNSQSLSHSVTLRKDKDLIASKQELPEPCGHNEKLGVKFGAAKLQGHVGCNESPEFRYKTYQQSPNVLPVQSNVLSFTRLSNNIFQQYDTNVGWMLYIHHMQLKEYHRVVAHQCRADCIEEKRALKDKQQNSKYPVHEHSDTQKEFMPMKRIRLTHLRREVRLGNQCSVIQEPAEN